MKSSVWGMIDSIITKCISKNIYLGLMYTVLIFLVYVFHTHNILKVILVCCLSLTLYYTIIFRKKELKLEVAFIGTAFVLGICYSILIPPFSVSDERTHFFSGYYWANRIAGISMEPSEEDAMGIKGITYVKMPIRDADRILLQFPTDYDGSLLTSSLYEFNEIIQEEQKTDENILIATYAPIPAYGVAAVAIIIGKIFSFSALALVLFARFMNLLVYILMCFLSIKLIPVGKEMMYAICLFPLSLQQGMSCSYDALLNASSFLYISYILFLAFDIKSLDMKHKIILLCLSWMISPMKGVLLPLVLLVLLIPKEKFLYKKDQFFFIILTIGSSTAVWLAYNLGSINIADIISPDNEIRFVAYAGEEGIYLFDILKDPIKYILIICRTILQRGFYIIQSITQIKIPIGSFAEYGFLVIFLVTSCSGILDIVQLRKNNKILLISIYLLEYFLYSVLTMISFKGKNIVIAELKGLYLIPFLPVLGLLIKNRTVKIDRDIRKPLIGAIGLMHFVGFMFIFMNVGILE